LLGETALDPATCAQDPEAHAIARARRGQLGLEDIDLATALAATTPAQLSEAAARFAPQRTAAVIAGGEIR
ncbi:MAG: hypothetical protein M3Y87_34305, partial [Myxococcota bacterium]|nr:hypothetical protein [Myxococcota bacterium]